MSAKDPSCIQATCARCNSKKMKGLVRDCTYVNKIHPCPYHRLTNSSQTWQAGADASRENVQ
jgi:hypothetical protein